MEAKVLIIDDEQSMLDSIGILLRSEGFLTHVSQNGREALDQLDEISPDLVLTDIRITWEDLDVEDLEPARIPDLFAGQSLLIHGRSRKPGTGLVTVEGRRMGEVETLRKVVVLGELEEDNAALGRLWALEAEADLGSLLALFERSD